MSLLTLEVEDIFCAHGPAWRQTQHDYLSLGELKVVYADYRRFNWAWL